MKILLADDHFRRSRELVGSDCDRNATIGPDGYLHILATRAGHALGERVFGS